jgi:hypothetical protein
MLQRIDGEAGVPVKGEGVYFRMRNGRRTVRFFATTRLLEALAHRHGVDEREAFAAFRRDIEMLAMEQYERHPFNDDSIVYVTESALPFGCFGGRGFDLAAGSERMQA